MAQPSAAGARRSGRRPWLLVAGVLFLAFLVLSNSTGDDREPDGGSEDGSEPAISVPILANFACRELRMGTPEAEVLRYVSFQAGETPGLDQRDVLDTMADRCPDLLE